MLECTVCLLLCRETQSVLLLRKDRTDFAGKYNGVGGQARTNRVRRGMCFAGD